jgi:hypothetical protein
VTIAFWIWLLFVLVTLFGGYWGTRGPTPWVGIAWAPPLLVWLLLFAICWAIAGNPVHTLVK